MQDLLEITHFLTRVRVAPGAEGFFDGGSGEAKRAAEMAAKLPVPALTRAWQLLLKGLIEVRDATRPLAACEMALIRLAYAADLPPTDRLVKDVMESGAPQARGPSASGPSGGGARAQAATPMRGEPPARSAQAAPAPQMAQSSAPSLRSLEDLAALAIAKGAQILKVHIENDMHLVALEPGRIEFRPSARAPRSLAGDLAQKLKDWTGERWVVTVAREGGAPTLAEARRAATNARLESVMAEPMVRAVLDRFPGAEVVRVIEKEPGVELAGNEGDADPEESEDA